MGSNLATSGRPRAGEACWSTSFSPRLRARALDQNITTARRHTHSHPYHVNATRGHGPNRLSARRSHDRPPRRNRSDHVQSSPSGAYLKFFHVPGQATIRVVTSRGTRSWITGDLPVVGNLGGTRSDKDSRTEWDACSVKALPMTRVWPDPTTCAPELDARIENVEHPFRRAADVDASSRSTARAT